MAQIKHIAIATQDADATAKFYKDVFGMREIAKLDSPNAKGYYLSDGNLPHPEDLLWIPGATENVGTGTSPGIMPGSGLGHAKF